VALLDDDASQETHRDALPAFLLIKVAATSVSSGDPSFQDGTPLRR
jgi:hypothetical protein